MRKFKKGPTPQGKPAILCPLTANTWRMKYAGLDLCCIPESLLCSENADPLIPVYSKCLGKLGKKRMEIGDN